MQLLLRASDSARIWIGIRLYIVGTTYGKTKSTKKQISFQHCLEKRKTFREDFFTEEKRSFLESDHFGHIYSQIRLNTDCTTDKLLRTKKKQTYLISPTSREIEDLHRNFFTDKVSIFLIRSPFSENLISIQTAYKKVI